MKIRSRCIFHSITVWCWFYPRDVWLRGDEVTEPSHGSGSLQHPLVHVDVQNLGPHLHLGFSDAESLLEEEKAEGAEQMLVSRLDLLLFI